jgi:hypothetical protein
MGRACLLDFVNFEDRRDYHERNASIGTSRCTGPHNSTIGGYFFCCRMKGPRFLPLLHNYISALGEAAEQLDSNVELAGPAPLQD